MDSAQVQRSCPICEGNRAAPLFTKGRLRVVRCATCSMIYANPVDAELASGLFYDRLGASFYLSPEKLTGDYAAVRFEREVRCFRKYCAEGRVLDVGCSTGAFLFSLKSRHPGQYTVVGTDVTSAALDHAESQGVPVIRTPFLEIEGQDAGFDAVTFWAVIEHLVQPKRFLQKASKVLKPGGVCFILVPNMKSLAVRLLGSKYRYIMPEHVNYFTAATLKAFARAAGELEVLSVSSTHFNPLVILKDFKAGADRVPDEERAALLKRTTAWKESRALQPIKLLYSGVERALVMLQLADNLVMVLRKSSERNGVRPAPGAAAVA